MGPIRIDLRRQLGCDYPSYIFIVLGGKIRLSCRAGVRFNLNVSKQVEDYYRNGRIFYDKK